MSDNNSGALITLDAAKSKISIILTKSNLLVQTLANRASNLTLNEDNLEEIRIFLSDVKRAIAIVEDAHKEIKKPFLEAGRASDGAKNTIIGELEVVMLPIKTSFDKICNEIDRRNRENQERIEREQRIKATVEANILDFSTRIPACKTRKELTEVERLINLEKSPSRASKYGEWHQFAIERYDEVLLPIIKDQKIKVEEYERIQEQLSKEANPELADDLKAKLDEKENEILQNQIKVQEQALNQQVIPSTEVVEVLPDTKRAGSTILCEIIDMKTVFKKHQELLNIELKLMETKKLGATLRDAGAFNGEDVLEFDGIKFTIERKWK